MPTTVYVKSGVNHAQHSGGTILSSVTNQPCRDSNWLPPDQLEDQAECCEMHDDSEAHCEGHVLGDRIVRHIMFPFAFTAPLCQPVVDLTEVMRWN